LTERRDPHHGAHRRDTHNDDRVDGWRAGTADLIVGDVKDATVVSDEHYEVTGELGLRGVLDDLNAALSGRA
jgi:hypothetical protein